MTGYVVLTVAIGLVAYIVGCCRGYGRGFLTHAAIMPRDQLANTLDRASKYLRGLAPYDTVAESYRIANELDDILDVIDPPYNPRMDHPDYRSLNRADDECFNPAFRRSLPEKEARCD